ncbi:MAG TPA: DUF2007 domain-containing protein [Thermopetrobacter sp.]|nr:DUF2007 domain-containing protein [Thermopetrobacter sp.]
MRVILRTNDLVLLSYARHLLAEAGIESYVLDQHFAAVEGSIGAFPRRLAVAEEELAAARLALAELKEHLE